MKKKRIFIDANPLLTDRLSGIGHTTLSLISHLVQNEQIKKEYEINLLVPFRKKHRLRQWKIRGVAIKPVYVPARVWNMWPQIYFAPPIDIFIGRGIYLFTNFKRWPLVLSKSATFVYDVSYRIFPQYVEESNLALLCKNMGKWIKSSDRIITISEASKTEISRLLGVNPEKISVVPCGVDRNQFKRTKQVAIDGIKARYGIEKDYLLFLSNIEPRKNIQRLVRALRQLPEYKGKYSLVLVGGMSWSSEAIWAEIEDARKEGWHIIKPERYVPDSDLPALLSGATALVHPTYHEGFGISPLQALACGTPVLVSDIPVMHEVVGEVGVYFDPNSTESVKRCIGNFLSHSKKIQAKMLKAGPSRAVYFGWDMSADRIVKLMDELK